MTPAFPAAVALDPTKPLTVEDCRPILDEIVARRGRERYSTARRRKRVDSGAVSLRPRQGEPACTRKAVEESKPLGLTEAVAMRAMKSSPDPAPVHPLPARDQSDENAPLTPQQRKRGERFAELIEYALRRMSEQGGSPIGAQARLAELLDSSTTMVHRYKTGRTDFLNIKVGSLARLAEVAELNIGTVYLWVVEGRDAAMAFERRVTGRPRAFDAEDLYRELGAALQLRPPSENMPPRLRTEEILDALDAQRALHPGLFDRLSDMIDGQGLIQLLHTAPRELDAGQWDVLAQLLDSTAEDLQKAYIR